MFFVECRDDKAMAKATEIFIAYAIRCIPKITEEYKLIEVHMYQDDYDSYNLCETAFQINFIQKNSPVCGHCGETVACGHLCFTAPIAHKGDITMDWINYPSQEEMIDFANGVFAVRVCDDVLDPEDWSIDTITIDSGAVVSQVNIYNNVYELPDMQGWPLQKLWEWLNTPETNGHPENGHEIKIIQEFT